MAKEQSSLERSHEEIIKLKDETNNLIKEVGNYTYCLDNVLSIIQMQFDEIRKIPSEKKAEYKKIKAIRKEWNDCVIEIDNKYQEAINTKVGGGAAGASLGVGLATMGPTAAMSFATTFGVASTGTAISSLSGAAATNAALAWLGGGALTAGGSGIAGGSLLLSLTGPVGWSLAGVAIAGSIVMFIINKSERERLIEIFEAINNRDNGTYKLAIIEIKERIKRIIDETNKLKKAIVKIGTLGTDYNKMTPDQKKELATYFFLMKDSSYLLTNPIETLKTKFTEQDFESFVSNHQVAPKYKELKKYIVYFANLLFEIKIDEHDRKLLAKALKGNKKLLQKLEFDKDVVDIDLLNIVNDALEYKYKS